MCSHNWIEETEDKSMICKECGEKITFEEFIFIDNLYK